MTLPWSGQQVEWLQAMGLEVLHRPAGRAPVHASAAAHGACDVPAALLRIARGVDVGPLIARAGVPRDVASRRAFWRELRAHRKAARHG